MAGVIVQADGCPEAIDVFRGLVADGTEIGASFAVVRGGALVAAAHGGTVRPGSPEPWGDDTLVQVFSAGKPLVAVAALLAVRAGFVTLDDPITRWWTDYRDDPAHPTTLRMILSHTSGKYAFPESAAGTAPTDAESLRRALAESAPLTEPGAVLVEHAATYGHLVDGVLAAAGAPSVAEHLSRVASRLGLRMHFGVPRSEQGTIATLEAADPRWAARYLDDDVARRALTVPDGLLDLEVLASPAWRETSFPAVGLVTDARSLALFYDDVHRAGGGIAELLGHDLHRDLLTPSASGYDLFVRAEVEWSLGMRVEGGEIGMGGMGGSSAWYATAPDYAMAYVTRGLADHSRANAVADAVERDLGR